MSSHEMSRPSVVEVQQIISALSTFSLAGSSISNSTRDFCPSTSDIAAAEKSALEEAERTERGIDKLEERMATYSVHSNTPEVPSTNDPSYYEALRRAQIYQQYWKVPGIDLNDGNNRARFRAAYCQAAFASRPYFWPDMSGWDFLWSTYDWDERLRHRKEVFQKFASYSIKGQAKLKQLPLSINTTPSSFRYVFHSSGWITNPHAPTDFCQGKLLTYDGTEREIKAQAQIANNVNFYQATRQSLQESNQFRYSRSKRFPNGSVKEAHWMVPQEPNEDLGEDLEAWKRNAITYLRLARYKTPDFDPNDDYYDEDDDENTEEEEGGGGNDSKKKKDTRAPSIPNRKYAKLRAPSPYAVPQDMQSKLTIQFLTRNLPHTDQVGAPGRPDARVRRRLGIVTHHRPLILHHTPPQPKCKSLKRRKRQLHYMQIRKTKTERLREEVPYEMREKGADGLDALHWVLDDEGIFHDWRYDEDEENLVGGMWTEVVHGEDVAAVTKAERRFSYGSE